MAILVCPLAQVSNLLATRAPERIVSLLDPDSVFPDGGPAYADRHLRLTFHDVDVATSEEDAPTVRHVEQLLAFVSAWDRRHPILIHCRAGIGRSTAAAFITACLHNPNVTELEIATVLRRAAPLSRPNQRLVGLADTALQRGGRMSRAIEETGRGLSWAAVEAQLRSVGGGVPFELPALLEPGLLSG